MKNDLFRKFLYVVSIICVGILIGAMIFLPNIVRWYFANVWAETDYKFMVIFLYLAAVPFLIIGISVVKLSKRLVDEKVFYKSSMRELKIISICSLIDFLIFFIGAFFIYKNLLCIAIMMGTLMVFIISSIVRELIGSGIELQEEVDLVI